MSACSWRRTKLWSFYSLLANAGRVLMRVKDVCPLRHRAKCMPRCLTLISKTLWWFVTWLMVAFSEKNTSQRIPVISNNSTPDQRHHPAEKTRLVLMAIPASVNAKVNSKPSRSGAYATAESQQRLNQCLDRKWHSPIPMKISYHSPNHWKSSVQPVFQLSWEFGKEGKGTRTSTILATKN